MTDEATKCIAALGSRATIARWAAISLSPNPAAQLNIECLAVSIIQRPWDLTNPCSRDGTTRPCAGEAEAVPDLAPALLKGRAPGERHAGRLADAASYRETTGSERAEPWSLQMLQPFIDADRYFQARRRTRNGSAGGPETSSK